MLAAVGLLGDRTTVGVGGVGATGVSGMLGVVGAALTGGGTAAGTATLAGLWVAMLGAAKSRPSQFPERRHCTVVDPSGMPVNRPIPRPSAGKESSEETSVAVIQSEKRPGEPGADRY